MNLSKVKAIAVVLTMAVAASAQFNSFENARTRALSGAPLSDISDIYNYPVLMMGYLNHAQVTWNGAGETEGGANFGSFIFTKSINDMIALGVTYTPVNFLSGTGFDDFTLVPGLSGSRLPSTPHLLLGFDLGMLKLGADLFFQHNANTREDRTETPGGAATNDNKDRVMNFGTRLSADLEFGDIGILAKLGFGFPSILRDNKQTTAAGDNNNIKNEATGLYLETGAEVSYPLFGIDLTAGFEYTTVNIQRKEDVPAPAITLLPYDDNRNSLFSVYLAGEVNIMETAAAVVAYEYSRRTGTTTVTSGTTDDQTATKTTAGASMHSIYAGVENSWDNAWKFDNLQLRTGLQYNIISSVSNTDNDRNGSFVKTSSWADREFVKPIVGLGLSKGVITIDMALSFGRMFDDEDEGSRDYYEWRGLLAGPTMAAASLTIKF